MYDPTIGRWISEDPLGSAVFHFGATNANPAATIGQWTWPSGFHAVICGGNDDPNSRTAMQDAITALAASNIALDGIADSTNVYIGSDGNWYTNPANQGA